MLSPNTGQPMRLVAGERATYTLRGQQFELGGPAWECADTGERFTTEEQDHQLLAQLHQRWRAHHGVAKETLRRRRQALGLSKAETASLLGLRKRQYRALEQTDQLPSPAQAHLLRLLLSDQGVGALLGAAAEMLPAETRRRLQAQLPGAAQG